MHFEDQWVRAAHRRGRRTVAIRAAFWGALVAMVMTAAVLVTLMNQGCAYAPQWQVEIEEGIRVSVYWPVLGDTLIPTNTATVRLTVWHEQAVTGSLALGVRAVEVPYVVRIDEFSADGRLVGTSWENRVLQVSARPADFTPITVDVARPIGGGVTQQVSIEVPGGANRAVRAEALDAAGELLGSDEAFGIRVRPGEVAQVDLELLVSVAVDIVVR